MQAKPDRGAHRADEVRARAAEGISGGATALPYRDQIQRAFGAHDVSGIQAHVGGPSETACEGIGADAYATADHVAFRAAPDLHTAAHEAAHVVQQRGGVQLLGGIGQAGDAYERNADQVADAVVSGRSAEALLGKTTHGGNSSPGLPVAGPRDEHVDAATCANCGKRDCECARSSSSQEAAGLQVQRTLGDGHDLTSPRYAKMIDLEAAFDGERAVRFGDSGRGVQAIQQSLYDLGFSLPTEGADGRFGPETAAAVRSFQAAHALTADGIVGRNTMAALDARFGTPVLPPAIARSAPWTVPCVRDILCPWSPHTVDVLRTRITLKSFDNISWADEQWTGMAWTPAPFPGGGYNTGTEIGVLNSSCETMAETLYHEVLHAEQPSHQTTTLAKESYAYRIGEEFSIAMGLGGQPALRSTDAQGREFADPAKVAGFVATEYPSVPAGGGGEEILDKGPALGDVRVRRMDGSIYIRRATIGEKVPGPMTTANEVVHPAAGWTCP